MVFRSEYLFQLALVYVTCHAVSPMEQCYIRPNNLSLTLAVPFIRVHLNASTNLMRVEHTLDQHCLAKAAAYAVILNIKVRVIFKSVI